MFVKQFNCSNENNRDLLSVYLLQTGLRARTLVRGSEGRLERLPQGLRYTESWRDGSMILTLLQEGENTSATMEFADRTESDLLGSAKEVLEAVVAKVLQPA